MTKLYILMRTDLQSLTPGKAIAQGAHAANQFITDYEQGERDVEVDAWRRSTCGGFGTTISLSVDEATMRDIVGAARKRGMHARIVHDPSYPIRDGAVTHSIPLDTCAYVFGSSAEELVKDLPLYR